jgi:hypothetical protein
MQPSGKRGRGSERATSRASEKAKQDVCVCVCAREPARELQEHKKGAP